MTTTEEQEASLASRAEAEAYVQMLKNRNAEIIKAEKGDAMNTIVNDPVNHPSHYTSGKIEVIDYIEDKHLGFCLGNAVKYISRCQLKYGGKKRIEDLEKAIFYLNRQVKEWEAEENDA